MQRSEAGRLAKVRKNSVGKPEIAPCAAGLCLGYKPISWPRLPLRTHCRTGAAIQWLVFHWCEIEAVLRTPDACVQALALHCLNALACSETEVSIVSRVKCLQRRFISVAGCLQ